MSAHERDRDYGGDFSMADMDRDDKKFGARRRARPPVDLELDYKRPETLRPFLTQEGKIVPSRVSRLNAHQQRIVTAEVKRARHLALLPFAASHVSNDPSTRFGAPRDRGDRGDRGDYRGGGDRSEYRGGGGDRGDRAGGDRPARE